MDRSAVLKPLAAGWYSSHWSIAPAGLLSRPFTTSSPSRVNQALAGLQDLYRRAIFLLGITSGLPARSPTASTKVNSPPAAAKPTPDTSEDSAIRPVPQTFRSFQGRENLRPQPSPVAAPVKPRPASGLSAFPPQPEPGIGATPAPENLEAVTAQAEVLIEAVHRLGVVLEAHEFLNPDLRQYGGELISRFAQTLSPFGLSATNGSLTLDREQLTRTYQENPRQVIEAYWGQNSLTSEIVSLAAAIVGAPGAYLMEPASHSPETYQPFQAVNPWFRVAPACFWQVA